MACLWSRFLPSRSATPSTTTILDLHPDCSDQSSHLNRTHERVLESGSEQPEVQIAPDLGSRWLRVDNWSDRPPHHSLLDLFEDLNGFQRCRCTSYYHRVTQSNIVIGQVEFDSAANALSAARRIDGTLNNHQILAVYVLQELDPDLEVIPGSTNSIVAMASGEEQHIEGPARKRPKLSIPVKLACKICTTEITGAYSKPCLRCKKVWCLDCVKTWFVHATQDSERMPARCCNMVMHHGVAGGTLSPFEFDLYKLRYDERTTGNALYCPVPTCSAFIPPRLIDASHDTVGCTSCTSRICTKCKQLSPTNHVCEEEDTIAKIKAFNYKTCPRCGNGVMKMYGCPHIRCICGTHWCFECSRPINLCYRNPCAEAIEDGQYENEEEEDVSESDDEVEDAGTIAQGTDNTQTAQLNLTTNTPINNVESPNGLRAVLDVFRGRRQRRANSEGESCEIQAALDFGEPLATSSRGIGAMAPAAQSALNLDYSLDVEEMAIVEVLAYEPHAAAAPLPAISTPLATAPNETSAQDAPPAIAIPSASTDGYESAVNEASEDCFCMHEQCRGGSNPLCTRQRRNPPLPDPITGLLTAPSPGPQPSFSVEGPTEAAGPLNPTHPPTPATDPLAAELPFAQSSTTNLNETDFWTRPNPAVFSTEDTPAAEPPTPNLDDPSLLDWEGEDYDFGDEPIDEPFDVWGCACNFTKLKKEDVDEHWLQDLKYLDCMKCFGEVVLQATPQLYVGIGGVKQLKDKLAWHCGKCGIVVCGKCKKAKKREMKGLLRATGGERS